MAFVYRPTLTRYLSDGTRVKEKSKVWRLRWFDKSGVRHEASGYKDKGASRVLLAQKEKEQSLSDAGFATPEQRQIGKATLEEHIADYIEAQRADGRGRRHIKEVDGALKKMRETNGWHRLVDITPASVNRFLGTLKGKFGKEKAGPKTRNNNRQWIRGFVRWCLRTGRMLQDPLASIRPEDPRGDIRVERRALSSEEANRLIEKTEQCEGDGFERAVIWSVALEAGLRVGEIRELRWADFLDGAEPVLILRGTTTKNGKTEHQPIREVLAERLRRLGALRPGAPLASIFQRKFFWKLPKLLRADLAQAKISSKDDQGRRVDVHALRHTYITALARGGAPLAIVQRLARHSSPVLTARVYVHLGLADKRQALSVLDQGAATTQAVARPA
ncbi:MAG: site-specific integrase [Planctomycetota bacterium]